MLQAPIKVYATDDGKDDASDDEEDGGDGKGAEERPGDE